MSNVKKRFGFAILTISDRCFQGNLLDSSGSKLKLLIQSIDQFELIDHKIVPDEIVSIKSRLIEWADCPQISCIITTGGTGLSSRDVTPEAINEIIEKEVPGIVHALMEKSISITPMAMLSRLKCGIRNKTLIINLPGSPKACEECFQVIRSVLKHALDQLADSADEINLLHQSMQRPQLRSKVKDSLVSKRDRASPFKMISIDEAFRLIKNEIDDYMADTMESNLTETIKTQEIHCYLNRIAAEDIFPKIPLPPFNASIKDGYAVVAKDGQGLRNVLVETSVAGNNKVSKIESGFCARISTGAAVPQGADAVVQIEDTELIETDRDNNESIIQIKTIPIPNQDIRPIGSDISIGDHQPLIMKYQQLNAIDLALIAASGVETINVFRRPTIAILSTGDEIVSAGDPRPPTSVWDSNRPLLMSLLDGLQYKYYDLGIVQDNVDEIFNKIQKSCAIADVIVSTGGVSMGEKDLLKKVLKEDFDSKILFGRVNLKPGKPTTFATAMVNGQKKFFFALPGNPVSAFVTFKIFVEPSLQLLSGRNHLFRDKSPLLVHRWIKCKMNLDEPYRKDPRPEFVRGLVNFNETDSLPIAKLTESNQMSSRLLNVQNANCLLFFDTKNGLEYLSDGEIIDAILL
ncbi:hypothetical protein NH340_JMT02653 [Sarcoptes scabiei]|nr:hypothetical protein NH340_JMT02653 [Sarcoptes scabiei]